MVVRRVPREYLIITAPNVRYEHAGGLSSRKDFQNLVSVEQKDYNSWYVTDVRLLTSSLRTH